MLTSTGLTSKAGMHDTNHQHDASDGAAGGVTSQQQKSAAGRGYRSQPSSPARTRRELEVMPDCFQLRICIGSRVAEHIAL